MMVHRRLFAVPNIFGTSRTSDELFSLKHSKTIWKHVKENTTRWGNMTSAQTSEDQRIVQQPDVAKGPGFALCMNEDTRWPIKENIDRVIMLECSACVLKRVALKRGHICALFCRATQIEMRVLLEGDTCTVIVTAEVPKNLWKWRTSTEFL
jgi:hypothetical protein